MTTAQNAISTVRAVTLRYDFQALFGQFGRKRPLSQGRVVSSPLGVTTPRTLRSLATEHAVSYLEHVDLDRLDALLVVGDRGA